MIINDIHNLLFEDTLARYLKGELSPEENARFIRLLKENPDLRNQAIAMARLTAAMQQVGTAQDQEVVAAFRESDEEAVSRVAKNAVDPLSGNSEKVETSKPPVRRTFNFKRLITGFSVAASILLCVFAGYRYHIYNATTQLGREYLAYFPSGGFARGEDDSVRKQLEESYRDIENDVDIEQAIATLESMWQQSTSDTYNDCTEHLPEIGWMLANAYLRDNEKEKALEVLSVLEEEYPADTAMGGKVRELIARIKEL